MARFRKVDPRIWNDEKFRDLSDQGKLLFLFLLTHPHMTSVGAMRATMPGLAAELGWDVEGFRERFAEPFRKGMVKVDEKASFLVLPNFIKYNPPENPNVLKSWFSSLDLLPECELKRQHLEYLKGFAKRLPKGFTEPLPEQFRNGYPNSMPNQEQEQEPEPEPEQEQEQEQEKEKNQRRAFRKSQEPNPANPSEQVSHYVDTMILPWHYREQFNTKKPREQVRGMLLRVGSDYGLPILVNAYELGANGASPHPARFWEVLLENIAELKDRSEKEGMTPLKEEMSHVIATLKNTEEPSYNEGKA